MFFTFLNKDNPHCPDLSLLSGYTPDEVLFYYYDSYLEFPLEAYLALKDRVQSDVDGGLPAQLWLEFFHLDIAASEDLDFFMQNDFLERIGPYYYPYTNTRFYFCKGALPPGQILTADDFHLIQTLGEAPETDRELVAYQKNRKTIRKSARNEAELLKDINMCLASLREVEKLSRHINYLHKLLEKRYIIVEQEELMPPEPDTLPQKPLKEEETDLPTGTLIPFSHLLNRRKKLVMEKGSATFNHDMKVYIIRYREYEKACDRFKEVLENWPEYYQDYMDRCFHDIEVAEGKLKEAQKNLQVYNTIIVRSFVHSNYQDTRTLTTFRHYLETGRAHSLQDCMNLFEEECHWEEIKAGQERIENTIHFMQNGGPTYRLANQHIEQLLKRVNEAPQEVKI